jgi:hypothetical protein
MLSWLGANWAWLAAVVVCGAYFAFYVMLARERRRAPPGARPRTEKDC